MNFDYLIDQIPDYRRFFYVDEFDERTNDLVKRFPKVVQVYEAGRSRNGRSIKVVKIGDGSKNALMFGCP
ncbi:MAG: M14 family zinc carboxypeptidase, partial [Pseudothermotoga sp.]